MKGHLLDLKGLRRELVRTLISSRKRILKRFEQEPKKTRKGLLAEATLHVYRNASAWAELSANAARYARSGGDGKGVCPTGLLDDFGAFWSKMQYTACGVH